MPREYVSFQTDDNVTLRAWFFKPDNAGSKPLPCLIMCHGWSVVKEMGLDTYAEHFVAQLPMSVLAYDHRGFGDSDTKEGAPRNEILPAQQTSDFSHAITYTQSRSDVDMNKIGIWGSSYSGGHSLWVGATDRRVKLVLCQVPMVDGWAIFHRLNRPDRITGINVKFQDGKSADEVQGTEQTDANPSADRSLGSSRWQTTCNNPNHPSRSHKTTSLSYFGQLRVFLFMGEETSHWQMEERSNSP
jgi:dienelactone hydrolase